MSSSIFKHAKCGGPLSLNLSNLFILRTPSIVISASGISPGVTELQEKPGGEVTFFCAKCSADIPTSSSDIKVQCSVCRQFHTQDSISYCDQLPGICDSCAAMLSGKKEPSAHVMKIADFIVMPREGFNFVSFKVILSKQVRMSS